MNILLIGDKATRSLFLEGMKGKLNLLQETPDEEMTQLGVMRIYTLTNNYRLYDVDVNITIKRNIGKLADLYQRTYADGIVCAFSESAEAASKFLRSRQFPDIQHVIYSPDNWIPTLATITLNSLVNAIYAHKAAEDNLAQRQAPRRRV